MQGDFCISVVVCMNPRCQVSGFAHADGSMRGNESAHVRSLSPLNIQWPSHRLQTWVGGAHCQSSPLHWSRTILAVKLALFFPEEITHSALIIALPARVCVCVPACMLSRVLRAWVCVCVCTHQGYIGYVKVYQLLDCFVLERPGFISV